MKIAIIGAGDVGGSCAQRIAESGLSDIILLDAIEGKAQAKAMDLNSASSIMGYCCSINGATEYKDIADAEIVILTAGYTRGPGQTREELLQNNARIIKDVSRQIARYCPDSIIIVVTNPVDIMTYLVCKTTGFSLNRIIGMGGVSDCARFNMLVAAELNTSSQNVSSVIIGAHADSMVVLSRLATVNGIPITEFLTQDRIKIIIEKTRNFGSEIVRLMGQGSAYYGPSAGVFLLVDSIIKDAGDILCVSTYLSGQYGLKDLCIGVPVKIGKTGIEEIIELKLTEEEKEALMNSADMIKGLIKRLGA